MKEFNLLTERGKMQRHRRILVEALARYPLDIHSVRFVSNDSRPVFLIKADQGSFAAKFHVPGEHALSQFAAEMEFLEHLGKKSSLPVETPTANSEGDLITAVESRWLPDTARFALISWVPGRQLKDLSILSYQYLGTAVAGLHKASRKFNPAPGFQILRNDRVFYWDEEVVLSRKDPDLLPPKRQELFKQGADLAQSAINQSWMENQPIVIHNDPHPCNIKIHHGKLYMYDFEDIAYGQPEQDLGTALYHVRFREDYSLYYSAFKKGYEEILPWPIRSDQQLDAFITARILMFANYVINYDINPKKNLEELESELKVVVK